jgi:CheY-like chemotaxis protein
MSPEADATRVLVIDERPDLRRQVTELLEGAGMVVYDVGSPLGATSLVVRLHIDVLVVGAKLSSTSGRRVAQLVRNSPRLRHLRVVLLVKTLPDQLEHSREYAEADAVIEESTIDDALLPAVNRLVRSGSGTKSKQPILLVDSDSERRDRLRRSLVGLGHAVQECASGAAAVARAVETRPRTIVVAHDLESPSATEVVEMLRADRAAGASRILLLEDDGGLEDLEAASSRCGANGVLNVGSGGAALAEQLRSDSQTL